ncbi:uncharacterized protein K444DRAFT_301726 [Hyaloscypha bicolor E]|uniref:Uncharacterized protein n=1 Tax=Hyaloscypha bicolor E TaxID=1095630 RepID=A0A2J6SEF2_9HELO|nr:uncharacterized protein K444DRAFT_301726 [Hyaloscypha bicolor E]PMD49138.1 hypothetical protein K444DRAFT_301726 [Hyaloscypha bicolor E]
MTTSTDQQVSTRMRPVRCFGSFVEVACGGNCINSPARNAERLNFFHHVVVPNMCSLDGSTTPPSFVENIVPWILSNMAIFMACCTQSAESGLQPHVSSETLSIKASVLPHMNKRLEDEFSVVAVEILPAVMHLVLVEWWRGNTNSLWAHLQGAQQMLTLSGGLDALKDTTLQQILIFTDFEIACCFDRDLCFQDSDVAKDMDIPLPLEYEVCLRSSLLEYTTTFWDDRETWRY